MPDESAQGKEQQQPPQVDKGKLAPSEGNDEVVNSQKDANSQQQPTEPINNANIVRLVDTAKENNRAWKIENVLMVVGIFINAAMAFATYSAVREAKKANEISGENLKLTQKAIARNDSMNREFYKVYDTSAKATIKSADAAMYSAKYADSSFRETQKEFAINNEPYLQLEDIKPTSSNGANITFKYRIVNLSNYPVKLDSQCIQTAYVGYKVYDSFMKNMFKILKFSQFVKKPMYIIKESQYQSIATDEIEGGKAGYNAINSGVITLFLYGEIRYTSVPTNKRRCYKFVIELKNDITNLFNDYEQGYFYIYANNYNLP